MSRVIVVGLAGCGTRTCQDCVTFCAPFKVAECQPGFDGLSPVACKCEVPSKVEVSK